MCGKQIMTLNLFLLLVSLLTISYCDDGDEKAFKVLHNCPRIHKAWHLSTTEEQNLFIEAFHILNKQGKITRFGSAHHQLVSSYQAHWSSSFFAWHRYLMWEV